METQSGPGLTGTARVCAREGVTWWVGQGKPVRSAGSQGVQELGITVIKARASKQVKKIIRH